MSTTSTATSTELLDPKDIGNKSLFSHGKDNIFLIISLILVSLFMWANGPKIAIFGISLMAIYALAALSLNYQTGTTGIINFGVVGFFAIGAYSTALATLLGWNWFPAILIGIIITCIISFLIGKSLLQLREDYFAIITITLGEIIRIIFVEEGWIVYPSSQAANWGGSKGLSPGNAVRLNVSILNIFNIIQFNIYNSILTSFTNIRNFLLSIGVPGQMDFHFGIPNWYMIKLRLSLADMFLIQPIDAQNIVFMIVLLLTLLIGYLIFERIYNSPLGRLNKAIREDDLAAETIGENVFNRKVNVLVVGNILIAIAGGFFGYYQTLVAPEYFLPIFTFYIWAIVVLGGIANNRGVIFGALIYSASFILLQSTQVKNAISGLFTSLMNPIIPSILTNFTNIINPNIKTWYMTFKFDFTPLLNLIIEPFYNLNLLGVIIPLSTVYYLVVFLVILGLKYLSLQDQSFFQMLNTNRVLKLLLNFILVGNFVILCTNIIINPPMTMIIYFKFNNIFLFSNLILLATIIILALIVYDSKRNKRNETDESSNLSENNTSSKLLKILIIIFILDVLPFVFKNLVILPQPIFNNNQILLGLKFVAISTFFTGMDPELARIIIFGILIMVFLLVKPEGVLKERQIKTVDSLQEYNFYYKTHINSGDSDLNLPKSEKGFQGDDGTELLKAKGLTKNFGGVVGLDNVSVSIKRGSLLGIIGPNGSGKSTFFNVLTGLLDQDKNNEGKIEFLKTDVTFYSISERARLGMGRTFQQSRLFKNLTVLENVLVSAKNQKGTHLGSTLIGNWKRQESELHQQTFQILQYLNILHIWNQKASDISGGQQKLVALARALMSQSQIILLDEPVAGVNPTLAKKIFEKIQNLHQNEDTQYVIIEHNMDVQLSFCDQIVVFNKGQIVAEGTPDEIRKNEEVLDAYLGH